MQIEYCDQCSGRISESDLTLGQAAWFGEEIYCRKCIEKKGLQIPPPVMAVRSRNSSSSSGLLKALPGSGIRPGVQPGSGILKSQAGSGIQKAQPGSGILRAQSNSGVQKVQPGSGIRNAAQPGSGIRAAAKPASGIRKAATPETGVPAGARSGILQSAPAPGRATPRGGVRRRMSRLRPEGGGDVWLSVVTAILTLALVGGIFMLLRS